LNLSRGQFRDFDAGHCANEFEDEGTLLMPDGFRLDGRVAVITGAARGQGAADARLLCAAGATIVASDLLEDEGEALCRELDGAAIFVRHDVREEAGWQHVVDTALDRFGRLDILVNNAGIHRSTPLLAQRQEDFEDILAVNLVGPFLGIRAVSGPMQNIGQGSIVNISSVAGVAGLLGHAAYGASKWGLRGLAKTAAIELGPLGIRVNTIIPGVINTAMMTPVIEGAESRYAHLPLGRHGEPSEIAPVVLFLASDASSYLTGAEIVVDGGMTTMIAGGAANSPAPSRTRRLGGQ
jgi:3alpha(or 20beta)-hydroxysteroid dehydrogenase